MSDLIVPSGMTRRHFMRHLAKTAMAIPAMQFLGALNANAKNANRGGKHCLHIWL